MAPGCAGETVKGAVSEVIAPMTSRKLKPTPTDPIYASVLAVVNGHGPLRCDEVAERLGITRDTATGALVYLANHGSIVRLAQGVYDRVERTDVQVLVTDRGLEVLKLLAVVRRGKLTTLNHAQSVTAGRLRRGALPLVERVQTAVFPPKDAWAYHITEEGRSYLKSLGGKR